MSAEVPIDIDALLDDVADSQASDQGGKAATKSSMYATWHFEVAGKRDKTHNGAQCIPCKEHMQQRNVAVPSLGSCLADLPSILTHVKNCDHHNKDDRRRAESELKILRDKKKPAAKRVASAGDTEASSGSNKRPRLSNFMALKDKPLTETEEEKFEQLCLQATISGNMPLQIWDDQAFRALLLYLRPQLEIPSRKIMSTRILDEGSRIAKEKMQEIVAESDGVCLATDSWTSIRRRQIMAFVLITSDRQALPHKSLDTTAERHFAEILRDHMLQEIEEVERDFKTKVKAIITDAASDCRKARSLVVEQFPHILSLDCFAHQMNLLVGSYLKHTFGAAETLKTAFDLINWWRWHLVPFEWLLAEMDHPVALLTGCLTRWGSQVAAIIRLLQFKEAMQVVLLKKMSEILDTIAKKDQRDKAEVLLGKAQQNSFWSSLSHIVTNLLPVRIALRVLESDSARMDSVLEQFGNMANHFSHHETMMDSLQKRWMKMDQQLFLLAYFLHPARQLKYINQQLEFAYPSSIAAYATELYTRLFGGTAEDKQQLFKQVAAYASKRGAFASSIPNYQDPKDDPIIFWSLMAAAAPQLSKLAIHLAQIAVNSAAVERLFSAFLNIQTKRRNKLVHERVQKIAAIKSLLPVKPRAAKKQAGNQYLGTRSLSTRANQLSVDDAKQQRTKAKKDTEGQCVDGPADMLVEEEQVEQAVQSMCQQVSDDEADDAEYEVIVGPSRCLVSELFVDMPAFDLNLLFEDEVDPQAS